MRTSNQRSSRLAMMKKNCYSFSRGEQGGGGDGFGRSRGRGGGLRGRWGLDGRGKKREREKGGEGKRGRGIMPLDLSSHLSERPLGKRAVCSMPAGAR